jgi:hypothetical protein
MPEAATDGFTIQFPPEVGRYLQASIGRIPGADSGRNWKDYIPIIKDFLEGRTREDRQRVETMRSFFMSDPKYVQLRQAAETAKGQDKVFAKEDLKKYETELALRLIKEFRDADPGN